MQSIRRFFLAAGILLFDPGHARACLSDDERPKLEAYAMLLQKYVYQGTKSNIASALVNYRGWASDPLHERAMRDFSTPDPKINEPAIKVLPNPKEPNAAEHRPNCGTNAEKAFWINAYNLLTIDLIVRNPEAGSIRDLGSWITTPWERYHWQIKGRSVTLDDIEHKELQKFHDPRTHMAIVCASLSCPDLRREPYREEVLDDQLNDQTERFLQNNSKGIAVTRGEISVSRIFKWYESDFGGEAGILGFIGRHSKPVDSTLKTLKYFDYNWDLNRQ